MNQEAERAWVAFVEAEAAYTAALAELRQYDLEAVLRVALGKLVWRRQALAVIKSGGESWADRLLPDLFPLSLSGHSLLGEVRKCISEASRPELEKTLPVHVDAVLTDQSSDYEAYRRTAELLHELEMPWLLAILVEAAERSSDPDVQAVAEDFGPA